MAASRRRFCSGVICLRQPSRVAADSQRAMIRAKLRRAGWGVSGSATRGSGAAAVRTLRTAARFAQVNSRRARRVAARYPASKMAASVGGGKGLSVIVKLPEGLAKKRGPPPVSIMRFGGVGGGARGVAISAQYIEWNGDKEIKCSCHRPRGRVQKKPPKPI